MKSYKRKGLRGQWYLRYGKAGSEHLTSPALKKLDRLLPPTDRIWVDPFGWSARGQTCIFCEEWLYDEPHAHISVIDMAGVKKGNPQPHRIIEENFQLSYPFIFSFEGDLYMLPESGAARDLRIYKCEEFPLRWSREATLMTNVRCADATLFMHAGRWWLFTAMRFGRYGLNHDLFLFSADSPLSKNWRPHPMNPIVSGFGRARPAGRLFDIQGQIYRPSQDNRFGYGGKLNISKIIEFTEERYSETLLTRTLPDAAVGGCGTHHIDWHDGLILMDELRFI